MDLVSLQNHTLSSEVQTPLIWKFIAIQNREGSLCVQDNETTGPFLTSSNKLERYDFSHISKEFELLDKSLDFFLSGEKEDEKTIPMFLRCFARVRASVASYVGGGWSKTTADYMLAMLDIATKWAKEFCPSYVEKAEIVIAIKEKEEALACCGARGDLERLRKMSDQEILDQIAGQGLKEDFLKSLKQSFNEDVHDDIERTLGAY